MRETVVHNMQNLGYAEDFILEVAELFVEEEDTVFLFQGGVSNE